MTQFLWKRTIPPKSFAQDTIRFTLPADAAGPLTRRGKAPLSIRTAASRR